MRASAGTGADHCMAVLKKLTTIGKYDARFSMKQELMVEMKRVTETSLMHETCDTLEHRGNTVTIKHRIEETGQLKYTTELKARGDQQSINNMQAISWLIPRNTQAMDFNRFTTTREDGTTKDRVLVEYRQVIGGYLCLCSNSVGDNVRERFHTLLAVCRCVASGAEGVDLSEVLRRAQSEQAYAQSVRTEERFNAANGSLNRTLLSSKEEGLFQRARPVFYAGLGTIVFAAFMQWTGMLEHVRETRLTHALLQIFYAQVGLCKSVLNPDMAANAEMTRFLEISKARAIAVGLIAIGLRETLDAGRRGANQQEAVERTAQHFKCEGGAAAVPWLVADTLEHLFRLDFLLLMMMLGKLLRVPCVPLGDLLRWLRTGRAEACQEAEAFYQMHANAYANANHDAAEREARGLGFLDGDALMGGADRLMPCAHCLYLTMPLLRVTMKQPWQSAEGFGIFCETLAGRLHSQFAEPLQRQCQVVVCLSWPSVVCVC